MLKISIVKVENPSCLWGRIICGSGGDLEMTEQYDRLMVQMNLFYRDDTQDLRNLKPSSLEEGQVCVVYCAVMKSWYRAVVESVIVDSVSHKARCLLVDHGERVVVSSDQIRVAVPNFLRLPFWVKRFQLAGIKPTKLRVFVYKESAELIPSTQWDSSATLYLQNLLQESTWTEAVLRESQPDSTSIELYLTINKIKICVNDDLVAKKFAYYSRKPDENCGMDVEDRLPVMLSSGVLTHTMSSVSKKPAAQTQPPPMTTHGAVGGRAGDWLVASSMPQLQRHELRSGEGGNWSGVTELTPASQPGNGSGRAAERFLKFLNPGSSHLQAADGHEELEDCRPEETTAASSTCTGQESLTPLHTSSGASVEPEPAETEKTWGSEEDGVCSRLLEWLNPERLIPDPDAADNECPQDVTSDPMKTGVLLHSALPVEPCTSVGDAPITDALRWVLQKKRYGPLSPADCYSWPAVARGCNTLVISSNADQPLSYLSPLLTHMLLNSIFSSFTSSLGPIAVLLCPGWQRVQLVYELLEESKSAQTLHPVIVLLGARNDEAKTVRIPKNCLLLVTTPFSLVRLLSSHCFMFLRLYHLVLDGADQLFNLAPDQMVTILQHFQKVTSREERSSCPQQLIAVAKQWTSHMERLLTNHMPHPCIVVTVPEEAALYANVQQIILMTLEINKISELLGTLDFNPVVGQKTLIVTNSAQEAEDVFKAVSNKSAFCLKAHEELTEQFDFAIQQWRKDISPGTHVLLVTTNECLKCLGIRDATCVVHYDFPTSPKLFGHRLFCMADNFRNLSERGQTDCPPVTRSVLLISERNTRHIVGVLKYLGRTNTPLPPELLSFAQGIHAARENQMTNRPLCSYLKSFGVCRDSRVCPNRHKFISQLDQSELPASGVIEVLPLYVKTASVFYGRILSKKDTGYDGLASDMASYYADEKPGAKEVLEGGLYAVQEDNTFHRIQILSVPIRGDGLFIRVLVRFIDIGKEEEVKSYQILQLPEQFHPLPAQAVEIIVCRVKPVDAEIDWHPKVTRAINQKIRGLQHRARAVLSLGKTVFVDPMVRVTQVQGVKTVINEYNVQSEILNSGMGVSNPDHLDLLRALCQEGESSEVKEVADCSGSGDDAVPGEEEEVLSEVSAADVREPSYLPQLQPLGPESSMNQPPAPELHLVPVCDQKPLSDVQAADEEGNNNGSDVKSPEWSPGIEDGGRFPADSSAAQLHTCDYGLPAGPDQSSSLQVNVGPIGTDNHDSTKSFHPQMRWYQTSDYVIVTVKLRNPENQFCDFYANRLVYSGRVCTRSYRAELELQDNILVERCSWEMKSNEPVLKLVKQKQGYWERLTLNKNIFVSYDLDHFEEDEDSAPCGQWFVENSGEDHWYVNSESDSD